MLVAIHILQSEVTGWTLLTRQEGQTSCDVRSSGEAAECQVGANEDGSWRQDRMTPVADWVQRRPQLQQQQGTHAWPWVPVLVLSSKT